MRKSYANGDYRLVMAIESASREGRWYRILSDLATGDLSCDCPRWIFARGGERSCKHVEQVRRWLERVERAAETAGQVERFVDHPLLGAAQSQWPGLNGEWTLLQTDVQLDRTAYRLFLLHLKSEGGLRSSGLVAFTHKHGLETARLIPGVAGWAGYAVAAGVAHQAGFPLAGAPPEHFRVQKRRSGTRKRGEVGLYDILRVGDRIDLGDGRQPAERAEHTLQLFLGEMYEQLNRQGFLDISSHLHTDRRRIYRLRRDPRRRRDRRIRLFEWGEYVADLCVVRAATVPEADHYLTLFLKLMSDEAGVLAVVRDYNIFPPYSDGEEQESVPAVWEPRPAA